MSDYKLPKEIIEIIVKLERAGYEAYAVGGAVRDLLFGKIPKDWDVATKALPEEIQKVFPDSLYENKFGTVTVKTQKTRKHENTPKTRSARTGQAKIQEIDSFEVKEVQITTYRIEEKYSDKRHPDKVKFTNSLEEDLARRDFTINAMALVVLQIDSENANSLDQNSLSPSANRSGKLSDTTRQSLPDLAQTTDQREFDSPNLNYKLIDPFNGQKDLRKKLIRAVGKPEERFNEDALRLMRAVRFAAELGLEIEPKTYNAIKEARKLLKNISAERIRDEFIKIISTPNAIQGIRMLADLGLLEIFLPELAEGIGIAQSKHHIYEVFEHNVRSLDYAVRKNYSLAVRLASLFHDIAKPQTKKGHDPNATFYNHEIVGARITKHLMRRLKFPNELINKVFLLIRYHQFYYQAEEVTASSVRRLVKNVGRENIDELIQVREADRIGSGVPKAVPYKLRHLKYMIEQVGTDPISVKMLDINGEDLMKKLNLKPSIKLGLILKSLLSEVLDDPEKNKKKILLKKASELNKLSEQDLKKNLKKIDQAQKAQEEIMKKKYYVK